MKSNNEHVLVPKKPTPDMILAALVVIGMGRVNGNIVDEIESMWEKMILMYKNQVDVHGSIDYESINTDDYSVLENRVQLLDKKVEELESENRRLVLDNYHLSLDLGYTTRKLNSLLSLSNKPMEL